MIAKSKYVSLEIELDAGNRVIGSVEAKKVK